jgi:DNA repair protein RadC
MLAKKTLCINTIRSCDPIVHNHPSGDPTPSKADIEMTREIMAAGEKLGISVHDHVVIAKSGETSFKSAGLL